MVRRQVPYLAAGRRPPPSPAFGVLVHVPSHYDLHALSSRVPDLVRVAWRSCQPAKYGGVSKIPLTVQRTHLFVSWVTGTFSSWRVTNELHAIIPSSIPSRTSRKSGASGISLSLAIPARGLTIRLSATSILLSFSFSFPNVSVTVPLAFIITGGGWPTFRPAMLIFTPWSPVTVVITSWIVYASFAPATIHTVASLWRARPPPALRGSSRVSGIVG